jgi:hypothetical protein
LSFFFFFFFFNCRYGEFIAAAILARMQQHGFDRLLHAASFSDSGSNCVLAKGLLTPTDAESCFNHDLKNVIDQVLGAENVAATDKCAAADFDSVAVVISHVRGSSVLRHAYESSTSNSQESHLELIAWNLTRWEGRVIALERFLLMRQVLMAMLDAGNFQVLFDRKVCIMACILFLI